MAYKKVPEQGRVCAFCGTAFTAAHRRRIYCSNSCNTRACVARKAVKAELAAAAEPAVSTGLTRPASVADTPNAGTTPVTLAHNLQNWTILSIAPHVPKLIGAVVQLVGELLAPRGAGPSTWLPAALQQPKAPLVAMEHESWDEPRFFVELPHGDHTLYYRAQQELLMVREPTGNLRQLRTAAEFATLTPAPLVGIAALQAQYTPPTISALSAHLLPASEPTAAPK